MLKVIKSEREYEDTLECIYTLMQLDLADDSEESNELAGLALFVEDYEKKHHPVAPPSPIEAITFRLEQFRYDKKAMACYAQSSGRSILATTKNK